MWTVDRLLIGEIRILEPEGHRTGLFKEPVIQAMANRLGLVGDHQADHRYHGGPEKALHQYAPDHYPRIAARFPAAAQHAVPGGFGENLASAGMTEWTVCIGDRYQVGEAELEVSQPRTPCWKINHRFGESQLAKFIQVERMTGWYYRVMQEGLIETGAAITLQARPNPEWTLERCWRLINQHRPDPQELQALAAAIGLTPIWVKRLRDRAELLSRL